MVNYIQTLLVDGVGAARRQKTSLRNSYVLLLDPNALGPTLAKFVPPFSVRFQRSHPNVFHPKEFGQCMGYEAEMLLLINYNQLLTLEK